MTKLGSARTFTYAALGFIALAMLALAGCDSAVDLTESPRPEAVEMERYVPHASRAALETCTTGVQTSGAFYKICRSEAPRDVLVVYAQGFVLPQKPLHIRDEEGGIDVAEFVTSRGFDYAATSYYTNGLIEPEKGRKDLRELITLYTQLHGRPERVLLLSFSNGTLLSTLMLEKSAHLIDGALASCGPHGSYHAETKYLGDIFVLFDFFFRDIEVIPGFGTGIPGDPNGIPQSLIDGLTAMAASFGVAPEDVLAQLLITALQNHPTRTEQLLGVIQHTSTMSRGDILFTSAAEGVELVVRGVTYNVFVANDATEKLGGKLFDNTARVYGDLLPSETLQQAINAGVARYEADRQVTAHLESRYETKGHLRTPLVALHNTRDPLVPFWHEALYAEDLASRASQYTLLPVERYGHCNFTPDEVGAGLDLLLEEVAVTVASIP